MVLMHMVSRVVEPKLLEAQCSFHSGQGTTDAMFVLRQLANMVEFIDNTQLHWLLLT
jgi:hypothetical protein